MSNALRNEAEVPFPSVRGVHKTHKRPRIASKSGTHIIS